MFANVRDINRIKRKQISAVISTNPIPIKIKRNETVNDGAGGYTTNEYELPIQIGMLIGREATGQFPERINEQGKTASISHILIMDRKADLQIGDNFIVDSQIHEIVYLHKDRTVASRAEVITTNASQ